jgi:microsomal dipeptidase-like Zn-dependent dipeptidase
VAGIDHVGIGTDNTGIALRGEPPAFHRKPDRFPDPAETEFGGARLKGTRAYWTYDHEAHPMIWTNWPCWATLAMLMRGYSDKEIGKLIGGNFLRLLRAVLDRPHDVAVV